MVQVKGETVQSCFDDLLQDDEVQLECTQCQNKKLSNKNADHFRAIYSHFATNTL